GRSWRRLRLTTSASPDARSKASTLSHRSCRRQRHVPTERPRRLDETRGGAGGREHGTVIGGQLAFHERDALANLDDWGLHDQRPWFGRRDEVYGQADGGRVESAFARCEDRRSHTVVEHGREDAALDEAS